MENNFLKNDYEYYKIAFKMFRSIIKLIIYYFALMIRRS